MENWKKKLEPVWTVLWALVAIAASAGAFNHVSSSGEWFYAIAGIANLCVNGYLIYKEVLKK